MDFLKIAIGNNVSIDKLKDWTLAPIGQAENSAELVAIVIKQNDILAKLKADELKKQSGFPIPVIEVEQQVDSKVKQDII